MRTLFTYSKGRVPLLPLLVLFVLLFGAADRAQAQGTPFFTATIQSPASNATDVSRTPTIVIKTNAFIDPASVHVQFPDVDSVTYNVRPTVLVVPKVVTDSLPYEAWSLYAASGMLMQIDDTTLHFQPNYLKYSTEYKVVVDSLRFIYGGSSNPFAPVSSVFRTLDPPHEVRATSLDGFNVIDCNDNIIVYFNREISNPYTSYGPVMSIEMIQGADTSGNIQTVPVPSTITPDINDHRLLTIRPSTSIPGQHYFLNINTTYLTGSTTGNVRLHYFVQNAFRVTMDAEYFNSTDPLPFGIEEKLGVGVQYYNIEDTVKLFAFPELEDARFYRWECPQLPSLHHSTASTVSFMQSCATVTNLTITAVYTKLASTTVSIEAEPGALVFVYDREHRYLGTTGTYTVINTPNDSLIIRCVGDGGYTFDEWQCPPPPPPPPFDPFSDRNRIKYSDAIATPWIRGGVTVSPVQLDYTLNGQVILDDGLAPSVYMWTTPSSYVEQAPGSRSLGIVLTDNCVEIYKSFVDGVWTNYDPGVPNATISGQLKQGGNIGLFFVRKKRIHLRVEQVMLENVQTEVEDLNTKVTHENATEVFVKRNGVWTGPLVAAIQYDQDGRPYKDYEFMCGDEVKVECNDQPDKGHYFSHWSDNIAGYVSPGNRASRVYELTISEALANFTAPDGHKQIRTRACFYMVFRLVEVGLHLLKTDGTFDLEYFPPDKVYVMLDDEPKDGRQVQYMPYEGTRIHYRFNQPYDKPSVEGGNVFSIRSAEGIVPDIGLFFAYTPFNNITHVIQSGFTQANELVFALHHGGLDAKKMGYYLNVITSGVKSKNLTPLENPMNFTVELEMPWVTIELEKVKVHNCDEDPNFWPSTDRGDVFHIFQSGMMGPDGNGNGVIKKHDAYKGALPDCEPDCTLSDMYQLEVGEQVTHNYTVIASGERMAHHGYIFTHVESKDQDGSELINFFGDILTGVGDLIGGLSMPALPEKKDANGQVVPPSFWESLLHSNATSIGSKLFKGIGSYLSNCSCNKDDHMGSAHLFLGKYDKWGKDKPYKTNFRDHNLEYWFRVTLN